VDHPVELLHWRESGDLQKPKLVHMNTPNGLDGTAQASWQQPHQE